MMKVNLHLLHPMLRYLMVIGAAAVLMETMATSSRRRRAMVKAKAKAKAKGKPNAEAAGQRRASASLARV